MCMNLTVQFLNPTIVLKPHENSDYLVMDLGNITVTSEKRKNRPIKGVYGLEMTYSEVYLLNF